MAGKKMSKKQKDLLTSLANESLVLVEGDIDAVNADLGGQLVEIHRKDGSYVTRAVERDSDGNFKNFRNVFPKPGGAKWASYESRMKLHNAYPNQFEAPSDAEQAIAAKMLLHLATRIGADTGATVTVNRDGLGLSARVDAEIVPSKEDLMMSTLQKIAEKVS